MPPSLKDLINKTIPEIITALKLNGLWAWLATKVLNYGGQALVDLGKKLIEKLKRAKNQEEVSKELDAVKADPNSEEEKEKKATDDFLNS